MTIEEKQKFILDNFERVLPYFGGTKLNWKECLSGLWGDLKAFRFRLSYEPRSEFAAPNCHFKDCFITQDGYICNRITDPHGKATYTKQTYYHLFPELV